MLHRSSTVLLTALLGLSLPLAGAAQAQNARELASKERSGDAEAGPGSGQMVRRSVSPNPAGLGSDPLTGPRSRLARDWVGSRPLAATTPILVLAGHADSQNIGGAGTPGAAVTAGAPPMYRGITDELYWNMVVAQAVEAEGRRRGLRIAYYRPPFRTIHDPNAPGTNWAVGRQHAQQGGYAMEIHFDAWGPTGVGSGLIPPLHAPFSRVDEELAREFGGYPMLFRDGLGGPRRGISLLEIGKLEGYLEAALRDPRTRPRIVQMISNRVVNALERGLGRRPASDPSPVASGERPAVSAPPGEAGSAQRGRGLQASSEGE
jgi:hypothetical protein